MSDPSNDRAGPTTQQDEGDALPPGARLAEFEIRQVLGVGGFGIVYRAWDAALQRDVALKEYMPASMAGRGAGERVTLRSRSRQEDFALGLRSFVNEARLLARFDQPALVKVLRFWEANGTAYMAMPLYRGRTLRAVRKEPSGLAFDDAWARALVEPLLDALEVMHAAEVYHRDIAPDNILWCDDARPVLLDFGAARLVLADRTQDVTAILKPQFAPIEQYAETPSMRQGPWTDLYALASTCYFMLTGRVPLPATARVMSDELAPLARLAPAGCSPRLLQALDWAMAVRPQDRPQSVAQLRDALAGRVLAPERAAAPATAVPDASAYERTIQATRRTAPATPEPAPAAQRAAAARDRASDRHEPAAAAPSTLPPQEVYLERPERSVTPPPAARSPFKPLLLLVLAAAAAAGAWTSRQQWMPAVGLRAQAVPPASPASSAEPSAAPAAPTAAASMPAGASPASGPVATAAASAAASETAPATATPAPEAAPASAADAPPAQPAHRKPAQHPRKSRRPPTFTLPPPVLPPPDESHAAVSAPARVTADAAAGAPTGPMAPNSPAPGGRGPRTG